MSNKNNKTKVIGLRIDSNQSELLNKKLELYNNSQEKNVKLSELIRLTLFNGVVQDIKQGISEAKLHQIEAERRDLLSQNMTLTEEKNKLVQALIEMNKAMSNQEYSKETILEGLKLLK